MAGLVVAAPTALFAVSAAAGWSGRAGHGPRRARHPDRLAFSQGVSLSWSAPISDGGDPIETYTVLQSTSPTGPFATSSGCDVVPSTSCAPTGLTNGTTYYFVVTATNAVGTSTPSAVSTGLTPVAPVLPSSNSYWMAGADGGVYAFGAAQFYGSMAGRTSTRRSSASPLRSPC